MSKQSPQINKELLFKELEHGINLKERIIYLDDDISLNAANNIHKKIETIRASNPRAKNKPITIQLSSFGGDIYGMFATIDILNSYTAPINILGVGAIMSAAAGVLIGTSGKKLMTKHSYLMLHEIYLLFSGFSEELKSEAKHANELQNKFYELCEKNSNKTLSFWKTKFRATTYLNSEQCLKYGLIDEVI